MTKYSCTENYNRWVRDTKEDLKKWRDIPFSWIRRLSIIKRSFLPKVIYRFSAMPIKIPIKIDIDKVVLKFIGKCRGPKITKTTLKRILEDSCCAFRTFCEVTVIIVLLT